MQTLFTSLLLLFAATSVTAQVPVAEHAFIVTKITITDKEGNAPTPSTNLKNTPMAVQFYTRGSACTFTTQTWHRAGNTHVSANYGPWRFVNIRNKEAQQTIGYSELVNRDAIMDAMRPANLPPGTTVRVMGGSGMAIGVFITDAELTAEKKEQQRSPDRALPALDTNGIQIMVILQDVNKELAGYPCKRAVISLMRNDSLLAQIKAWYNTEVRLPDLPATGNPFDGSLNILNNQMEHFYALAKLPGLAMQYEMPDLYGNTISVEVTKLKINKKPHKNQFKAPGSANIRPFMEVKGKQIKVLLTDM